MKKAFIASCAIVLLMLSFVPVSAADVGVGASFWYAKWVMTPVESRDTSGANGGPQKTNFGYQPLAGPVITVKFAQDWSVASAFLVSRNYSMDSGPNGDKMNLRRMDSDTTLNYSLFTYFKVFAGCKFMQFAFPDGYHRSAGPGLGLGFIIPVFDTLYVVGNGSGSYLFGRHKDGGSENGAPNDPYAMREYGFNSSAGLAYYVSAISLTVNAGYRYQYFYTNYVESQYNDLKHTFKGPTLSVIYSF